MSITLDLPTKVDSELMEIAREDGLTPSEIIAKALSDHLVVRKFRQIREKMQKQVVRVYTDEEIFEMFS